MINGYNQGTNEGQNSSEPTVDARDIRAGQSQYSVRRRRSRIVPFQSQTMCSTFRTPSP